MKTFKHLIPFMALLASFGSHAAYLSIDDWHESSDGYQGMKPSADLPDIYYAVGQSNTLMFNDTYEIQDGYRVVSGEELKNIYLSTGQTPSGTPYHNKGGWDGYTWNGVLRRLFILSDTAETNRSVSAGGLEGAGNVSWLTAYLKNDRINQWAGFVLIKDDSATNGLYSYSKGYYNASDVPIPLGLSFLGFGGLLLTRKKAVTK